MTIRCAVEFFKGKQVLQPSQRNILRMLCVRFATEDTKSDILERKGNLLQFTHALMLFWKEGKVVKSEQVGNLEDPFTLTITKKGGDYSDGRGWQDCAEVHRRQAAQGRAEGVHWRVHLPTVPG